MTTLPDDAVWSLGSIRRLFNGEARYVARDATGKEFEGIAVSPTAHDLRRKAESGEAPLHSILDVIQLERAINAITSMPVRAAALMRVQLGYTDEQIDHVMTTKGATKVAAWRLIDQAVRAVAQHEGARAEQVGVEREGGTKRVVCWRCMQGKVTRAGQDCGAKCPALADPAARPKREDIDSWPLEQLIATQEAGSAPGSKLASNMEAPVGLVLG